MRGSRRSEPHTQRRLRDSDTSKLRGIGTLANEDGIAREHSDVRCDVPAAHDIVVVEPVAMLLAVLVAHDHHRTFVRVLQKPAGFRDGLQHVHFIPKLDGPRLGYLANHVYLATMYLLDNHGGAGISDELCGGLLNGSGQLLWRHASCGNVVQHRQRNLAVWPYDDLGRQFFIAPEHDVQNVLDADDIVLRQID